MRIPTRPALGLLLAASGLTLLASQAPGRERNTLTANHGNFRLTSSYSRTGHTNSITDTVHYGKRGVGAAYVEWLSAGVVMGNDFTISPGHVKTATYDYTSSKTPIGYDAAWLPDVDHSVIIHTDQGATEFNAEAYSPRLLTYKKLITSWANPLKILVALNDVLESVSEVKKLRGSRDSFEYSYTIKNESRRPLNIKWLSLPLESRTGIEISLGPGKAWHKTLVSGTAPEVVPDFLIFNGSSKRQFQKLRANRGPLQFTRKLSWIREKIGGNSAVFAPALVPAQIVNRIE